MKLNTFALALGVVSAGAFLLPDGVLARGGGRGGGGFHGGANFHGANINRGNINRANFTVATSIVPTSIVSVTGAVMSVTEAGEPREPRLQR